MGGATRRENQRRRTSKHARKKKKYLLTPVSPPESPTIPVVEHIHEWECRPILQLEELHSKMYRGQRSSSYYHPVRSWNNFGAGRYQQRRSDLDDVWKPNYDDEDDQDDGRWGRGSRIPVVGYEQNRSNVHNGYDYNQGYPYNSQQYFTGYPPLQSSWTPRYNNSRRYQNQGNATFTRNPTSSSSIVVKSNSEIREQTAKISENTDKLKAAASIALKETEPISKTMTPTNNYSPLVQDTIAEKLHLLYGDTMEEVSMELESDPTDSDTLANSNINLSEVLNGSQSDSENNTVVKPKSPSLPTILKDAVNKSATNRNHCDKPVHQDVVSSNNVHEHNNNTKQNTVSDSAGLNTNTPNCSVIICPVIKCNNISIKSINTDSSYLRRNSTPSSSTLINNDVSTIKRSLSSNQKSSSTTANSNRRNALVKSTNKIEPAKAKSEQLQKNLNKNRPEKLITSNGKVEKCLTQQKTEKTSSKNENSINQIDQSKNNKSAPPKRKSETDLVKSINSKIRRITNANESKLLENISKHKSDSPEDLKKTKNAPAKIQRRRKTIAVPVNNQTDDMQKEPPVISFAARRTRSQSVDVPEFHNRRITRSKSVELGPELLYGPLGEYSRQNFRKRSKSPGRSKTKDAGLKRHSKISDTDDTDVSGVSYKSSSSYEKKRKFSKRSSKHIVPKIIPTSPVRENLVDPRVQKSQAQLPSKSLYVTAKKLGNEGMVRVKEYLKHSPPRRGRRKSCSANERPSKPRTNYSFLFGDSEEDDSNNNTSVQQARIQYPNCSWSSSAQPETIKHTVTKAPWVLKERAVVVSASCELKQNCAIENYNNLTFEKTTKAKSLNCRKLKQKASIKTEKNTKIKPHHVITTAVDSSTDQTVQQQIHVVDLSQDDDDDETTTILISRINNLVNDVFKSEDESVQLHETLDTCVTESLAQSVQFTQPLNIQSENVLTAATRIKVNGNVELSTPVVPAKGSPEIPKIGNGASLKQNTAKASNSKTTIQLKVSTNENNSNGAHTNVSATACSKTTGTLAIGGTPPSANTAKPSNSKPNVVLKAPSNNGPTNFVPSVVSTVPPLASTALPFNSMPILDPKVSSNESSLNNEPTSSSKTLLSNTGSCTVPPLSAISNVINAITTSSSATLTTNNFSSCMKTAPSLNNSRYSVAATPNSSNTPHATSSTKAVVNTQHNNRNAVNAVASSSSLTLSSIVIPVSSTEHAQPVNNMHSVITTVALSTSGTQNQEIPPTINIEISTYQEFSIQFYYPIYLYVEACRMLTDKLNDYAKLQIPQDVFQNEVKEFKTFCNQKAIRFSDTLRAYFQQRYIPNFDIKLLFYHCHKKYEHHGVRICVVTMANFINKAALYIRTTFPDLCGFLQVFCDSAEQTYQQGYLTNFAKFTPTNQNIEQQMQTQVSPVSQSASNTQRTESVPNQNNQVGSVMQTALGERTTNNQNSSSTQMYQATCSNVQNGAGVQRKQSAASQTNQQTRRRSASHHNNMRLSSLMTLAQIQQFYEQVKAYDILMKNHYMLMDRIQSVQVNQTNGTSTRLQQQPSTNIRLESNRPTTNLRSYRVPEVRQSEHGPSLPPTRLALRQSYLRPETSSTNNLPAENSVLYHLNSLSVESAARSETLNTNNLPAANPVLYHPNNTGSLSVALAVHSETLNTNNLPAANSLLYHPNNTGSLSVASAVRSETSSTNNLPAANPVLFHPNNTESVPVASGVQLQTVSANALTSANPSFNPNNTGSVPTASDVNPRSVAPNDNFRIRLPLAKPYGTTPSPPLVTPIDAQVVPIESVLIEEANSADVKIQMKIDENVQDVKKDLLADEDTNIIDVDKWYNERMNTDEIIDIDNYFCNVIKTDEGTTENADPEPNMQHNLVDPLPRFGSVDSGFSSPPTQVSIEYSVLNKERYCICSMRAELLCSCGNAIYCSAACQQDDWPNHRKGCSAPRPEPRIC